MREIPLEVIVSWPVPNYFTPETRRWDGSCGVGFIVVTAIAVALRIYVRIYIQKWFRLDDI
jgi:hypothetical protein